MITRWELQVGLELVQRPPKERPVTAITTPPDQYLALCGLCRCTYHVSPLASVPQNQERGDGHSLMAAQSPKACLAWD